MSNYNKSDDFQHAVSLFLRGNFEQSSKLVDNILVNDPENVVVMDLKISCLLSLGVILHKAGNEKAYDLFKECMRYCDLMEHLDLDYYNSEVKKRNVKNKITDLLNAVNSQSEIDEYDEDDTNARTALDLMKNREYEKAIPYFDKYLKQFPNDGHKHFLKGVALSLLDDDHGAINCYDLARKLQPQCVDDAHYNWRYANSLYSLNRYEEALEMAEKALKIEPNNPEYLNSKAQTLVVHGIELVKNGKGNPNNCFNQSLECFDKVLKLNPDHDSALFGKSQVLKLLRDIK